MARVTHIGALLVAVGLGACGDSSGGKGACVSSSDCADAYVCFNATCRKACVTRGECSATEACIEGVCEDVSGTRCGQVECDANATCVAETCRCDSGYEGDGQSCADVNECTTGTHTCDPNAACTNTSGTYTCQCKAGFSGDGFACDPEASNCTPGGSECDANATCTTMGQFDICVCNVGFSGDGLSCANVDECTLGTDDCSELADCTDQTPMFSCACITGYTGDGRTCTNVDECVEGGHDCAPEADCQDTPGRWTCTCGGGYEGDGTSCTDIDECEEGTHDCSVHARCDNAVPGFECTCLDGFVGDGVTCRPEVVKLSRTLVAGGDVARFAVSPDGNWVVYLADAEEDARHNLYAVHLDGTGHQRLNDSTSGLGDVVRFAISPLSTHVAYLTDDARQDMFELYAVAFGTDAQMLLTPDVDATEMIREFRFTPDGQRILYRADTEVPGREDLYSAAVDGTDHKRLSSTVSLSDVRGFVTSPDPTVVLYTDDHEVNEVVQLYAAPVNGGSSKKINPDFTAGQDVRNARLMEVVRDGTRVIYRADVADEVPELFSGLIDGGGVVALSSVGGAGEVAANFALSPDGSRVVFQTTSGDARSYDLRAATVEGTASVLVFGDSTGEPTTGTYAISSDGVIAFVAESSSLVPELYVAGGNVSGRVHPAAAEGQAIGRFAFSLDGTLLFVANHRDPAAFELFAVTVGMSTPKRISRDLTAGGNVTHFAAMPDGSRVIYLADAVEDGVFELFSVALDGTGDVKLNQALVAGGDVIDFVPVAPDQVVFRADAVTDGVMELFMRSNLDVDSGAATVANASGSLSNTGVVFRYFLNEASSGTTPTQILDSTAQSLSAPLIYEKNLRYTVGSGGRGLEWHVPDAGGNPEILTAGTKIRSRLEGSTEATVELVVDVDAATSSADRLIYFGELTNNGTLSLHYNGQWGELKFYFTYIETVSIGPMRVAVDLTGRGRTVLHLVVDTSGPTPVTRMTPYVDGVVQPWYYRTGDEPPQNETLVFTDNTTFRIGNRRYSERSVDGRIFYAAVYDVALSESVIEDHAERLQNSDDP